MKLEYEFMKDKKFPHWINFQETAFNGGRLDISSQMNINQWCSDNFGELGIKWGFYYENPPLPVNLLKDKFLYSWRFLNSEDAALFKLTHG